MTSSIPKNVVTEIESAPKQMIRFWPALLGAAVSLASFGVLVRLPYTTSWMSRIETDVALERPGPNVHLGNIRWAYEDYTSAPSLEPFRRAFASCSDAKGVAAARCVTQILNTNSPVGDPRYEFVDAQFDPAEALRVHLAGGPGHCTARSGLGAAALLALGVPARVVQLLHREGGGHNVFEVYDANHGWVMFDPSFESSVLHQDNFASSVEVAEADGALRWRRPRSDSPDPNTFAGSTINYPEPWLYTRVGPKCARWPFRGCFAQVGPAQFLYGPAQKVAMAVTVLSGLFCGFWSVWWLRRRLA